MILRTPSDLGAILREARKRAGWSQTRLADTIGASRQWVSLVENGKTRVEFDLVVRALRALGLAIRLERIHTEVPDPDHSVPLHRETDRTRLTRGGRPLDRGRPRPRRDGPESRS